MGRAQTMFEATVEKLAAVERREDGAVAGFGEEDARSVKACVGELRGMIQELRTRPSPRQHGLAKLEREILTVLRKLREEGDELVDREERGESWEESDELRRQRFHDLYFAATQDFFGLLERLDD